MNERKKTKSRRCEGMLKTTREQTTYKQILYMFLFSAFRFPWASSMNQASTATAQDL
jgi:hypothetical protein